MRQPEPRAPRPLMERAYHALRSGSVAVAVAPTAYGKTVASPWVWAGAERDGVSYVLIHVAPLRSLVWRVFEEHFRPLGGRLQAHAAPEGVRSPYMLSPLVVSTLDSFLWNLYRIPVAEALKIESRVSQGHYYPALMSIYTSTVVLDEAHMYLWESPDAGGQPQGVGWAASMAALELLAAAGGPVQVETATVRPCRLGEISRATSGRGVRVAVLRAPAGSSGCPYLDALRGVAGDSLHVVADRDWEAEKLVSWETTLRRDSLEKLAGEIADEASRGPVLVVANTVGEAVRLYLAIRGLVGDSRAVLVHGRLSEEDRRKAENAISRVEKKGGVVVATQTAEAGVDVNAITVYTAPAPLESLAQRAGRACRRDDPLSHCMQEAGRLVIAAGSSLGPYSRRSVEEALEAVGRAIEAWGPRGLNWRATCDAPEYRAYASLLAGGESGRRGARGLVGRLLRAFLMGDAQPEVLLETLDNLGLCGLARDTLMVEASAGGGVVVSSLTWLLRNAHAILELGPSGAPLVEVEAGGSLVTVEASRLWLEWGRSVGCSRLLASLRADASRALGGRGASVARVRFRVRPGAYRQGLGLLLPGEYGGGACA